MKSSSSFVNENDSSPGQNIPGLGLPPSNTFARKHHTINKKKLQEQKFTRKREKSDWQLLMDDWHVNPHEKQNNEEVRQKELEARLKTEYYVRAEGPQEYAECVVETSIEEEYPYMVNHLVRIRAL